MYIIIIRFDFAKKLAFEIFSSWMLYFQKKKTALLLHNPPVPREPYLPLIKALLENKGLRLENKGLRHPEF